MLNDKKSIRSFIVMCIILIALILNGVFTLGSVKNNPTSFWETTPNQTTSSNYSPDYVVLHLDDEAEESSEVDDEYKVQFWINAGQITRTANADYALVNVAHKVGTYSESNLDGLKADQKLELKKGVENSQFSWTKLDVEMTTFHHYWIVFTEDNLEINEIVFTNADGKVLKSTLYAAQSWNEEGGQPTFTLKDKLTEQSSAPSVIDEQDMFKKNSSMTKKYNFTSEEAANVNMALMFFTGEGRNIQTDAGPLGLELLALSLKAFGINTLGVRFIPYLFFVLTVVLMYAFGRRLFGDSDAGLILSSVYLIFGLGLSSGSVGSVNSIAVFFVLLSVFFIYGFYRKVGDYVFSKTKHTFRAGKTQILVPVLLSALSFALAFSCSAYSLFVLPAIIVTFALGLVRVRKIYKLNASVAEFDDEKVRNDVQYKINFTGSIVMFVLSFALFTFVLLLLFYVLMGNTYTQMYGVANILQVIGKDMKIFGFGSASSTFMGWIAGAASELIYSGAQNASRFTSVYISMNVALQAIALISFICTTGYVIYGLTKKYKGDALKQFKAIAIPYAVLASGMIFSWAMFGFVKGATVIDYLFASVFTVGFIPLAYKNYKLFDGKAFTFKGKDVMQSTVLLWVILAIGIVFFALGYVMFAGIEVPMTAAKILFNWWLM